MTDIITVKSKFKPSPVASPDLSTSILELVKQAAECKQLQIGAKGCRRILNKNIGRAMLVIMAADTEPIEMLQPIPILSLCNYNSVHIVFVPSKSSLGKACGLRGCCIMCCIVDKKDSNLTKQIETIQARIETITQPIEPNHKKNENVEEDEKNKNKKKRTFEESECAEDVGIVPATKKQKVDDVVIEEQEQKTDDEGLKNKKDIIVDVVKETSENDRTWKY